MLLLSGAVDRASALLGREERGVGASLGVLHAVWARSLESGRCTAKGGAWGVGVWSRSVSLQAARRQGRGSRVAGWHHCNNIHHNHRSTQILKFTAFCAWENRQSDEGRRPGLDGVTGKALGRCCRCLEQPWVTWLHAAAAAAELLSGVFVAVGCVEGRGGTLWSGGCSAALRWGAPRCSWGGGRHCAARRWLRGIHAGVVDLEGGCTGTLCCIAVASAALRKVALWQMQRSWTWSSAGHCTSVQGLLRTAVDRVCAKGGKGSRKCGGSGGQQ